MQIPTTVSVRYSLIQPSEMEQGRVNKPGTCPSFDDNTNLNHALGAGILRHMTRKEGHWMSHHRAIVIDVLHT